MPNNDYIKRSDALKTVRYYKNRREENHVPSIDEVHLTERQLLAQAINNIPAADVEPKQRWIPVTERLPEDDTIVLVVSPRYHKPYPAFQIGGVWYDGYNVACQAAIDMKDEDTIDDTGITHWTPLPEPPKGEDDAEVH